MDVFVCLTEISGIVVKDNVLSVHPAAQGGLAVASLTLVLSQVEVLLAGEDIRQQVQQVLGTALALHRRLFFQLGFQLLAEVEHLAPEVVLHAPADEVSEGLVPLAAVSHI